MADHNNNKQATTKIPDKISTLLYGIIYKYIIINTKYK